MQQHYVSIHELYVTLCTWEHSCSHFTCGNQAVQLDNKATTSPDENQQQALVMYIISDFAVWLVGKMK